MGGARYIGCSFPHFDGSQGFPYYAAWWTTMHSGPLDLDEFNSDGDGEVRYQLEDDDTMQVENPIHYGPPQVGDEAGGLDVLVTVSPALGKKGITCSYL